MDVAPVTTPASTTIVPSRTICWPLKGVIFRSVPAVELTVFPLMLILSTWSAVSVPTLVAVPADWNCMICTVLVVFNMPMNILEAA